MSVRDEEAKQLPLKQKWPDYTTDHFEVVGDAIP